VSSLAGALGADGYAERMECAEPPAGFEPAHPADTPVHLDCIGCIVETGANGELRAAKP
jgi:hypothetical protein